MLQAIHVVRVPVPEMFNFRMARFDLTENTLLIVAILEEANGAPLCAWTRVDKRTNIKLELLSVLAVRAENTTAGLVIVELVALVEDPQECSFRHTDVYILYRMKSH
jgi:hypothetical protein